MNLNIRIISIGRMIGMYHLIEQSMADRVLEILEQTALYKPINLEIGNYSLEAYSVSETNESNHFYNQEFNLLTDQDEYGVLKFREKYYNLFVHFGEWRLNQRLQNAHICVGSEKIHKYFFQIELSQSVFDNEYVYIIKNATNLAGDGSFIRLFSGSKSKQAKHARLDKFLHQFDNEIIEFDEKKWSVISKISIDELYNEDYSEEIYHGLMNNMLRATLLVEQIRSE